MNKQLALSEKLAQSEKIENLKEKLEENLANELKEPYLREMARKDIARIVEPLEISLKKSSWKRESIQKATSNIEEDIKELIESYKEAERVFKILKMDT